MTTNQNLQSDHKQSMLRMTLKRLMQKKAAVAGAIIMLLIIMSAVLAPVIAPYGFADQDLYNTNALPCAAHIMGTDSLGRDIFSRILYGGRSSLVIGFSATLGSAIIGTIIGSVTGYFGGIVDDMVMRFLDILQAVPGMLMAIAISATLGSGFWNCIIAITISGIPGFARMARASCLSVRDIEYVEAARSINASQSRIIFRHMLPNTLSPIFVMATMNVATAILTSASLSFVGLGVLPPAAEWGAMAAAGRSYLRYYPHLVIFPAAAIMLVVLSINMLGDGLRDALDPRLKD